MNNHTSQNGFEFFYGSLMPRGLTATWIDDYCLLTWLDSGNISSQFEIWESKNGSDYYLAATTGIGVYTYKHYTYQNATMNIKIREVDGGAAFSDPVTIITPLVFKCDQSVLTMVDIHLMGMFNAGHLVVIDWGDGNTTNFNSVPTINVTHNYAATGQYFIKFTGDVDWITYIEFYNQTYLHDTVVTKWCLPAKLYFAHFYGNNFIGDITNIEYPSLCQGCYISGNNVTGDVTFIKLPAIYFDLHFVSTVPYGLTGDLTRFVLPFRNAHIGFTGYMVGDLSLWTPWLNVTYGGVILGLSIQGKGITGDLSGWTIPDLPATLQANTGCHFTKLPRGNFRKVDYYQFINNACPDSEIDAILIYIDNYFSGGIVPLTNIVIHIGGGSMGTPSAAGLAAKASIIAKYTAAGFVATITTN